MTKFSKGIAMGLSALVLAGTGVAVYSYLGQDTAPSDVPPDATHYLMPDPYGAGTFSNWTWCSQGLRITQTYVWKDDATDSSVLLVRETRKGDGC